MKHRHGAGWNEFADAFKHGPQHFFEKAKNEVFNPNSDLRQHVLPAAAQYSQSIPVVGQALAGAQAANEEARKFGLGAIRSGGLYSGGAFTRSYARVGSKADGEMLKRAAARLKKYSKNKKSTGVYGKQYKRGVWKNMDSMPSYFSPLDPSDVRFRGKIPSNPYNIRDVLEAGMTKPERSRTHEPKKVKMARNYSPGTKIRHGMSSKLHKLGVPFGQLARATKRAYEMFSNGKSITEAVAQAAAMTAAVAGPSHQLFKDADLD